MPQHSECSLHFLLLCMSDSCASRVTPPLCNGGTDLIQYLLRLGIADPEEWSDLHRKLKVEGVFRVGYVQREAVPLRIRRIPSSALPRLGFTGRTTADVNFQRGTRNET